MPWYVFALGSAVLVSLSSILVKKILIREHAMELAAVLAFFNAILVLPILFIVDLTAISFKAYGIIFIAGFFGSLGYLFASKSIRHMELSEASPLFLLSPGLTAFLAFVLLGEGLTQNQLTGIVLLMIGAYVFEIKKGKDLFQPFREIYRSRFIHFAFWALLFYGFSAILDRVVLSRMGVPPLAYIGVGHIFVLLNFIVLLTIFHDGYRGIKHGMKIAGPMILLLAFVTIAHRYLATQAVAMAFIGLVVAVKRSSALFTTIIGGELFHESHLLRKSISVIIMLVGVFLIAI